jgi:ribonuclease P protein component
MVKTISLQKNKDFGRIYRYSKYYVGKHIILYSNQNNLNLNRLGITASKRTGKSVKRNRLRKLVRENYRLFENDLKVGYDIVFVVRKNDFLPSFKEIKKVLQVLSNLFGLCISIH